jgi:zinc D-Ala-D-Ala carboxypeptidase
MPRLLRSLAILIVSALALAGCLPMAMFASGSGPGYSGLRQDWGTYVSHNNVNALCISPKLRFVIWEFEGRFGRKVVMNSGYRNAFHNASVGGADNSYHTKCMAADFYIPGVPKRDLIAFAWAALAATPAATSSMSMCATGRAATGAPLPSRAVENSRAGKKPHGFNANGVAQSKAPLYTTPIALMRPSSIG